MSVPPRPRSNCATTAEGTWRMRAACLLGCMMLVAIAAASAAVYAIYTVKTVPELSLNPAVDASTTVVDRDGRLLRAFLNASGRWHLPVSVDDVDRRYIDMLIAFEDRRFYAHAGVDALAVVRAGAQLVWHGRLVSGASTLTMQVARLLSGRHERSISGKLKQMAWAIQLERKLSKRAILNLYLQLAPFGGNIEGVRAASLSYFGKEPKRLSIAQAALLVALPQSPERRRPDRHTKAAQQARAHVLNIAAQRGVISPAQARRAATMAIPNRRKAFPTHAAHLAETLAAKSKRPRVIRTTLSRPVQARLEALAKDAAARIGPKVSVAILVAQNDTGDILARVGSAGYFADQRAGAVDMIEAVRSPGSTLKPLIYGLGFDAGLIHPETLIEDRPTRFGAYAPQNFADVYHGTISIREALARSLNVPAVKVLDRVGSERLLAGLRQMRLHPQLPDGAKANLSVALGGVGLTMHDLVTLYTAIARGGASVGLRHEPLPDANVPVAASRRKAVLSDVAAHYVTAILRSAPPPPNARGGQIAFKTGTSYGHRDAWAIGFDGRHTIGVWIGRADATATPGLIGRLSAAPILFDAFQRVGPVRTPFAAPPGGTLTATGADLPPPLQRFSRSQALNRSPFMSDPVRIQFPPDRSQVAYTGGAQALILRAEGGTLPLTWLANGRPVATGQTSHSLAFQPAHSGFLTLQVIDANGQIDRATVRLTP